MPIERLKDFWNLDENSQKEFVGQDLGVSTPIIIVELDEQSQRWFYHKPYAPVHIWEYKLPDKRDWYQLFVESIDDSSLNMQWDAKKMEIQPWQATEKILAWLKRIGYFVNLSGLEAFCTMFGKPESISHN